MKKTFNLHKKLNNLFINKLTPELLIEFICKNNFKLINEIPFVSNELGKELRKNYPLYYSEVIEKSGEEWLETLFPDPELSKYFSFKKFYIGLVGRLFLVDNYNVPIYGIFFGDPKNWNISYRFILNDSYMMKNYSSCQFILLDNYSQLQIEEELGSGFVVTNWFVLYKTKYKEHEFNDEAPYEMRLSYQYEMRLSYQYEMRLSYTDFMADNIFSNILENYKQNYEKTFDKKIDQCANKIWLNMFVKQIENNKVLQAFYKNQIEEEKLNQEKNEQY